MSVDNSSQNTWPAQLKSLVLRKTIWPYTVSDYLNLNFC
jgi:hypothetical protein